MNLTALRSSLRTQINAIVHSSSLGEIYSSDVGTIIMRETQHLINRLAILEDTPFGLIDSMDQHQCQRYRLFYRKAIDHLMDHNPDCFTVVEIIEDLRFSEIKDKSTLDACLGDLARRCDNVYKSGWTLTKEFLGYGERKWADVWQETLTGIPANHDRTMDAPRQSI